ncbi:MAG: ChaN family lipoprotein [Marivibrio sp.]|uniref:ChaN family lipoprotein n=1 Tax=Marivibrio sp. TaxID=2039719 RepID=UPI0032EACBC9
MGAIRAAQASVAAAMLATALLAAAPALAQSSPQLTVEPAGGWRSTELIDHPLVGRVYDARRERFIPRAALIESLAAARFALLGERHDNPDHHLLQAEIVRALGRAGAAQALVFEMLTPEQAPALPARGAADVDLDALGLDLTWEARGWPDWSLYRPIFAEAMAARLALAPGAPGPEALRSAATAGLKEALPEPERARLALGEPMAEADRVRLLEQLFEAHCGYAPRDKLSGMLDAQRLKDAAMADALIEQAGAHGPALLIAGAGHIREDWGVPAYLDRRDAGVYATLAFAEARPRVDDPGVYVPRDAGGEPAVDFLWFTPRVDLDDPCAKFEDQLEAMGGAARSQ